MNQEDKLTLKCMGITYLLVTLVLLLVSSVSAQIQTLPSVKVNTCATLPQSYANSTWQNITTVIHKNVTYQINKVMSNLGNGFFNYTFCNTSDYGEYIVNGIGDVDGVSTTWQYNFEVTPSGAGDLSTGQGIVLVLVLIIILGISVFFFILGLKVENVAAKLGFIIFSAIGLLVGVLYILLVVYEALAQSPTLISGLETFYTVLKILAGIAMTGLFIFIGFFIYRSWQIKRGYRDEY